MTQVPTILEQLSPQGSRGLRLMLGTDLFIAHPNGVTFKFKGNRKINHARIVLNGRDTYDLTLSRIRGRDVTTVSEHNDVYAEDLQSVFEDATGLRTGIPRFTSATAAASTGG